MDAYDFILLYGYNMPDMVDFTAYYLTSNMAWCSGCKKETRTVVEKDVFACWGYCADVSYCFVCRRDK